MKKPLSFVERLVEKLQTLGISKRKATTMAQKLAPVARAAFKAELKAKEQAQAQKALKSLTGRTERKQLRSGYEQEKAANVPVVDAEVVGELVPVKGGVPVNGFSLRIDLPIAPMVGMKGIEMLRVMDGLSSHATYLVAAVKADVGIVAIRSFGGGEYNVKFYPNMAYWEKSEEELRSLGATNHLQRQWYERMYFKTDALDQLLRRLEAEAKPRSRAKALLDRLLAITVAPLIKAFTILHTRGTKQIAS